jgi:drug/metabolite transporter (DMT)-like permease
MDKNRNQVYILMCLAAILWGVQPVVVKDALKELSPTMITFCRYIGISLILLVILAVQNGKNIFPPAKHLFTLLLMGINGIALNNVLQFSGLQYSTVINCTLVSATTPAVTAAIAYFFIHEKVDAVQWIGISLSLLGVLFLVTHGSLEVLASLSFNYGDILFFASQICWAIYMILGRKVMTEISPMVTTAWAGLAGALLTGMYAVWQGEAVAVNVSSHGILSMLYLTIGGGVLAMTWWNHGVKVVGPSQAAIFMNLMPLVGMVSAVVFVNEQLGWREIVGGVWIIFGVYLTTHSEQITFDHKHLQISENTPHNG